MGVVEPEAALRKRVGVELAPIGFRRARKIGRTSRLIRAKADGRKPSLVDTDHVWGVGGSPQWVWKTFLRGHNLIFMDPYDDPEWKPILAREGVAVADLEGTRRASAA